MVCPTPSSRLAFVATPSAFLPGSRIKHGIPRSPDTPAPLRTPIRRLHQLHPRAQSGGIDKADSPLNFPSQKEFDEVMRRITQEETSLTNFNGTILSHKMVQFDEDGLGPRDRYVYVEELDCIGCTHCQTTATETFFMEPDYGRARVFNQTGDLLSVVEEAIDTCPVNCIYYVSWEDLVVLETMRVGQKINNSARLVGGQDFMSSRMSEKRNTSLDTAIMRCEDCPGRGCRTCPMFGVGENPEYLRRQKVRETAKKNKKGGPQRKRRAF